MSAERDRPAGWPGGFATGPENRRATLVLSALRGITPGKLIELAHRDGSAAACLAAIRAGRAGSDGDQAFAREIDPLAMEEALVSCGARFVAFGSAEYPAHLENLSDPPAALFVLGQSISQREVSVAVVGARNCSELGRDLAHMIGRDLAISHMSVVSGAARGIDAAAHEGALQGRGHTVAVLGCGIDQVYPRESRSLIARIAEAGTLVSEYAPGVQPEPFRFPARNRIIAALAAAVVVVEGAQGSGSMISAEHALDLGRTVFAVPGAITNPLAHVPNTLIREGATLIRSVDDLLQDLDLPRPATPPPTARPRLSPAERAALDAITEPVLPERVARALGLSIPEVLPILIGLEMKGLVRSVGGRFEPRVAVPAD